VSFGANLKRERELRGVSLEEISKATKISLRLLEALEADRFDLLPGGIFRKSFIKSYAKYIGLNDEKLVQEYSSTVDGASGPPSGEEKFNLGKTSGTSQKRGLKIAVGVVISLLILVASFWYLGSSGSGTRVETPGRAVNPASSITPAQSSRSTVPKGTPSSPSNVNPTVGTDSPPTSTQPVPTMTSPSQSPGLRVLGELSKTQDTPPAVAGNGVAGRSKPEELTLKVAATEKAWLSVGAGEAPLYSGVLQPEEIRKFSLQKPLKLVLGNAGGVKLSINNTPFASLGKSGDVRVLQISAENYQQYLAKTP
jgi:cytoskeleton protein RodZ